MTSVRAALGISFIERYALIALNLISYVVLARLLTPNQIGLYSVTAALIGIAQVVRDFGMGNYLIQEKDLTSAKLETAVTISLLISVAIFFLALLATPYIARFYGDPQLVPVLRVFSLNFLILPFCSVALAMLRRSMDFRRLLSVNLTSAAVGFVATIGLATAGLGSESLVWGTVTCNATTAMGAWIALNRASRPKRFRFSEWRSVVRFGKQSTFAGVVVSAAMDANDLVVGKALGFAPVAILNRAMGLMNLFQRDLMGAARNVAFPAFAAAHRADKSLEPMFVESFAMVIGAGWPFYGFLCLFPLEALRLMAGPQWDAAVPFVAVFAIAGVLVSTATLTQTLVIAVGRVDLASQADTLVSIIRLVLVTLTAAFTKDLEWVAIAFLVSFALQVPIFFVFKQRCMPCDWKGMGTQAVRSGCVTAVALLLPAIVSLRAGIHRSEPIPLYVFLPVCVIALAGWVFALRVCAHPMAADPMYRRLFGWTGIPPLARSL